MIVFASHVPSGTLELWSETIYSSASPKLFILRPLRWSSGRESNTYYD